MQINDDFPPCDGVLTALVSYGTQDVWLQHHDTEFDMCNLLLNETGCRHKHVYTRLGTSKTVSSNSIVFVLNKTCDFINDVDLVIPNPNDALIDHLISYIKV
jgi:hypothetical protein